MKHGIVERIKIFYRKKCFRCFISSADAANRHNCLWIAFIVKCIIKITTISIRREPIHRILTVCSFFNCCTFIFVLPSFNLRWLSKAIRPEYKVKVSLLEKIGFALWRSKIFTLFLVKNFKKLCTFYTLSINDGFYPFESLLYVVHYSSNCGKW